MHVASVGDVRTSADGQNRFESGMNLNILACALATTCDFDDTFE